MMPRSGFRPDKRLLSQYLLVLVTFLLMALIGNYFASGIVTRNLATYGEEVITASAETLQTYLEGHQTTFEDIAFVVSDMYNAGAGSAEIEQELIKWNTRLHGVDARYQEFIFIYGIIDETFVQGSDWNRPASYVPKERPWYIGALETGGRTYYSDPYIDAQTNEWILSLSKTIRDQNGDIFGVLAFDVFLQTITDYVSNMHLMNHGYGVLLDSELKFVVHPSETVFGVRMDDFHSETAVMMRENNELNAYNYTNLEGKDSVLFSRKLINNWYLYVSAQTDEFYSDVNFMLLVLMLAGLIATVLLCIILTIMHMAKTKADEETRIQASLLESANAHTAAAYEAHNRAKIMLDATPFGCKMWDKDLRVFEVNKAAVKLFGVRDEEELIERYSELSPERQPDGMLSSEKSEMFIRKAFDEGYQIFEWLYKLPDGTMLPAETIMVRVAYGDDIAVAGYTRDLTEYKRMMAEIDEQNEIITSEQRKSEELAHWYKSILDATPFPITVTDTDMKWTFVNTAVLNFLGTKLEDMLGEPCSNWGSDICNTEDCGIQCARRGLKSTFFRQNGHSYEVEVETLTDLDGETSGYIEILHDITAILDTSEKLEEALVEAQQASQSKSDFLANMSHEIRTPMNAIIGMTEMLLSASHLTEHDMDCLNDISVSAHSLLTIINDILDMSKIESGKMELNPTHYDFKAMIGNIESMFTYVTKKKGIAFKLEVEGTLPETLFGDDVRLRQVLTNICGNAVKFTEKGSVTLKITVPEDAQTVTMQVIDTGMGIRKEDIPKLFNAFVQSKSEENRYVAGTGLGLVISKSFVEMMGGSIGLDSEFGTGTTFTIAIPLVAGDPSKVRHDADVHVQSICAPQAKILVVDDNEFNLKVAHGLLELFEIDADTASSGKEALNLVTEKDYDIVFMDHMMPEMDGIETTAAIRALGGKFGEQNIVALTANAIHGAREMFLENGFNGFLSKPIEMADLTRTLVEWLPSEKVKEKTLSKDAGADAGADAGKTGAGAGASESGSPGTAADSSFWETIGTVDEIDVEIGLRRFNDLKEMYRESLKLFFEKLPLDSEKLHRQLSEKDYPMFAISVHAIKSTLASIGASELSDSAFRLEMASKNSEIDYCENHFPNFHDRLVLLHKQLTVVFPPEEPAGEKQKGDEDELRQRLIDANDAIDSYDNDAGIEILNSLLAFDFSEETNAVLAQAVAALKQYDFDAAKDALLGIRS